MYVYIYIFWECIFYFNSPNLIPLSCLFLYMLTNK